MPKIENWGVVAANPKNPKDGLTILIGTVTGHPNQDKCPDGQPIITSALQMLDTQGHIGITRNTTYELGEPSQEWLDFLDEKATTIEDYGFDNRN